MLKNNTKSDDDLCKIAVAPFVGAWIETISHLCIPAGLGVAPFVGAWIETSQIQEFLRKTVVAPFVGAWIETGST